MERPDFINYDLSSLSRCKIPARVQMMLAADYRVISVFTVHLNDEATRELGLERKTFAWYLLVRRDGARIAIG